MKLDTRLHKDDISNTPYRIIRETCDGVILQAGNREHQLWTPSDGLRSYRIIIDGKEYEYSKVVEDSKASTRKNPFERDTTWQKLVPKS